MCLSSKKSFVGRIWISLYALAYDRFKSGAPLSALAASILKAVPVLPVSGCWGPLMLLLLSVSSLGIRFSFLKFSYVVEASKLASTPIGM